MEKEEKRLIIEICTLIILLIIVIPICINASRDYREKKEVLLKGTNTSVDITYNGDMKKVTIYSNHDDSVRVNLVLKTNKLLNDYQVLLDDDSYVLSELDNFSDGEYLYYNLGIYEVDRIREFDFKLSVIGDTYYSETITYSFVTEGLFNESGRL